MKKIVYAFSYMCYNIYVIELCDFLDVIDIMQKELIMRCLPTAFCHASTVLALADGNLLCCWFGGTHEGESDVGIYLSRRADAGWSEPQLLVNGAAANWNPVLFAGADCCCFTSRASKLPTGRRGCCSRRITAKPGADRRSWYKAT